MLLLVGAHQSLCYFYQRDIRAYIASIRGPFQPTFLLSGAYQCLHYFYQWPIKVYIISIQGPLEPTLLILGANQSQYYFSQGLLKPTFLLTRACQSLRVLYLTSISGHQSLHYFSQEPIRTYITTSCMALDIDKWRKTVIQILFCKLYFSSKKLNYFSICIYNRLQIKCNSHEDNHQPKKIFA